MALEAVIYQQDPFMYGYRDCNYNNYNNYNPGFYGLGLQEVVRQKDHAIGEQDAANWDCSAVQNNSSDYSTEVVQASRRKRRRTRKPKNMEELESQRMTHIAAERNRRKQMNDYLAVLRSLMPSSYAQRGDQASIVGGAINYVKELEQLLQHLEASKLANEQECTADSNPFSKIFNFPQYASYTSTSSLDPWAESHLSAIADIEVSLVESHANIKILSKKRPKQLAKMIVGLQSICLDVVHLNMTRADQLVLYTLNAKVEDECQLTTVNEIAAAVHDLMRMIQEDSIIMAC